MKKMRKLIPAFAMLLVSAIMMSTASFAWFTMNDVVEATGMQLQAKADGSLVIDDEALTFQSAGTDVDFQTAVAKLKPIHLAVVGEAGQWQLPDGDVDPITGKLEESSKLVAEELTTGEKGNAQYYFFDQTVYIGSAGDQQVGDLVIKLEAPKHAGTYAWRAYSVAIYVMDSLDATPSTTAKPAAILHVDPSVTGRNTATLTDVTIPSIVGVGDQNENKTGLKIVLRVFVDGDLESQGNEKIDVPQGYEPKAVGANATYSSTKQYFVEQTTTDDKGNTEKTYIPAVIPEGMKDGDKITANWFTYEAKPAVKENFKYINSNDVPTAASSLSVTFDLNTDNQ